MDNSKKNADIDAKTTLYAVLGNPVEHSQSPRLFNAFFKKYVIPSAYVGFKVEDMEATAAAIVTLGIKGTSVSIPHKIAACSAVHETDDLAKKISAINTIKNKNGVLLGRNFDGYGFLEALLSSMAGEKLFTGSVDERVLGISENRSEARRKALDVLQNKKIFFLGAGGAAMGIAITLRAEYGHKAAMHFAVRNPEEVEEMLHERREALVSNSLSSSEKALQSTHNCHIETLDDFFNSCRRAANDGVKYLNDVIVVNTTPVGMHGNSHRGGANTFPFKPEYFSSSTFAADIVYTPCNTEFLRIAALGGASTLTGDGMFVNQASLQLSWWLEKPIILLDVAQCYKAL